MCFLAWPFLSGSIWYTANRLSTVSASFCLSVCMLGVCLNVGVCVCALACQFHRCFRALLRCQEPQRGSSLRNSSKAPPKAARGSARKTKQHNLTFMVASLGQPTSDVPQLGNATLDSAAPAYSDMVRPTIVSLMAHYNGGLGPTGVTTPRNQLQGGEEDPEKSSKWI